MGLLLLLQFLNNIMKKLGGTSPSFCSSFNTDHLLFHFWTILGDFLSPIFHSLSQFYTCSSF